MAADRQTSISQVSIRRIYEPPEPADGRRVLVDRLWPRGIRKEDVHGEWLRDVSPSNELRKWAHSSGDFDGFCARYADELAAEPAATALASLLEWIRTGPVTLLYAAKDEQFNNAAALRAHVLELLAEEA